jgi:hypothetical protein
VCRSFSYPIQERKVKVMPKEDAKVKSTDAKTPTGGAGGGKATAAARAPSGAGQGVNALEGEDIVRFIH